MPKALIYLYEGSEVIETLATLDILKRCGVEVVTVAKSQMVNISHGVTVKADVVAPFGEICDAIIIPGGPGWKNVQSDEIAKKMVDAHVKNNKLVCAICAAPSVALGHWGYLDGKRATCYPNMQQHGLAKAQFVEDRVVVDGNFITSRAAGTALEFAFCIVEKLGLEANALEVKQAVLFLQP